jgi:hypothetical protein
MAETREVSTTTSSVVFKSLGSSPTNPSAGKPVVASVKLPGFPHAVVHGHVNSGTSQPGPIFDNPA